MKLYVMESFAGEILVKDRHRIHAETNNKYFDFRNLKIYIHIGISKFFIFFIIRDLWLLLRKDSVCIDNIL